MTSLGMPAVPPPTPHPTWKQAWDAALYGADGFFRREAPAAHFRTSVHASPLFARALARMTREAGLDTVVDIGAGRGELLTQLHALDPDLDLLGVEVAARPAGLDPAIAWTTALPEAVEGLVVANEWLDNIPCHVVEVAPDGRLRVVHVDPATGEESLGQPLTHSTVAPSLAAWVERWWPLDRREPGTRAEVGSTRDTAWADVVGRVTRGIAVAVDYGHTRDTRPPLRLAALLPRRPGGRRAPGRLARRHRARRGRRRRGPGRRRRTPPAGRAARPRRLGRAARPGARDERPGGLRPGAGRRRPRRPS